MQMVHRNPHNTLVPPDLLQAPQKAVSFHLAHGSTPVGGSVQPAPLTTEHILGMASQLLCMSEHFSTFHRGLGC